MRRIGKQFAAFTCLTIALASATAGAEVRLKPGDEFSFNFVLSDDGGGNESLYWLQLAPGLAGLQDVTLYPRFVLAKQVMRTK